MNANHLGNNEVRLVKPLQFDDQTPQTTGMRRLAAISQSLVGSESLWAGIRSFIMFKSPNLGVSVLAFLAVAFVALLLPLPI